MHKCSRKSVSMTTNMSPALANRVRASAKKNGISVSAYLETVLAFIHFGRGREAPYSVKRAETQKSKRAMKFIKAWPDNPPSHDKVLDGESNDSKH